MRYQINYGSGLRQIVTATEITVLDGTIEWTSDAMPRPLVIGVGHIESLWELPDRTPADREASDAHYEDNVRRVMRAVQGSPTPVSGALVARLVGGKPKRSSVYRILPDLELDGHIENVGSDDRPLWRAVTE